MKKLIYAAILNLAFASFSLNVYAYGNTRIQTGKVPYITGAVAFPSRVRPSIASRVRHTLRLQVPKTSSALSQLIIDVPDGLIVKNDISVFEHSGRKINTNHSVNGSQVIVAFPETIAPGTSLDIDMNNVSVLGVSNAWLYQVSAKIVGIDVNIPLGVAQIHTY